MIFEFIKNFLHVKIHLIFDFAGTVPIRVVIKKEKREELPKLPTDFGSMRESAGMPSFSATSSSSSTTTVLNRARPAVLLTPLNSPFKVEN